MNKNLPAGLLLPVFAIVALSLAGCSQATSSKTVVAKTLGNSQAQVLLPSNGLKVQTETYTLKLLGKAGALPSESPQVKVTMPMAGGAPMQAPTTVKPQRTPGMYELTSEFTMAGDWTLQVQPNKSAKPVMLTLPVSE